MARATLADVLDLGLPPEALRSIPTRQAPVTATGAGAGFLRPDGRLDVGQLVAMTLPVRVEVVAGGALGTATWRWSPDAGATWSPTTATPSAGSKAALVHPGMGVDTGLDVLFVGTQTAGAVWTWTATSTLARQLAAAQAEMDSGLTDRYPGGIVAPYPADLIAHEAAIAVWLSLSVKGFDPKNATDKAVVSRRQQAVDWRDAVAERRLRPAIAVAAEGAPLLALSDPLRA